MNLLSGKDMKKILSIVLVLAFCLATISAQNSGTTRQIDQKEVSAGQADAQRDLRKGVIRYEIIGEPSVIDQELAKAAKEKYDITIVFHGCCVGPRVDYDQAYLETVVAYLKKKYSFDPVAKIEQELRNK